MSLLSRSETRHFDESVPTLLGIRVLVERVWRAASRWFAGARGFAPLALHVQGDPRGEIRLGTHAVHGLLQLAGATVGAFYGVGCREQELVVQKGKCFFQGNCLPVCSLPCPLPRGERWPGNVASKGKSCSCSRGQSHNDRPFNVALRTTKVGPTPLEPLRQTSGACDTGRFQAVPGNEKRSGRTALGWRRQPRRGAI